MLTHNETKPDRSFGGSRRSRIRRLLPALVILSLIALVGILFVRIHSKAEIIKTRKMLNDILVQHTGQELAKIEEETERDHYMSAEEALAYGLVDEVLSATEDEHKDKKK